MATSQDNLHSNPGKLKLDKWQEQVLEHQGNVTIRAGRQVGKSTVIAIKAFQFAMENAGTVTLVIAASQRQSSYLFSRIRLMFDEYQEESLGPEESVYEEKPTLSKIILKNGSRIYCLPTGRTGVYIRGYTVDLLIADEAAYIPEMVWVAIMPMIAVSKKTRGFGWLTLLSTPFGKGGFFFESFNDPDFKSWHISSENCPRFDKKFLMKEKRRMSKVEYAQEYLGEFIDDWCQFFATSLIKKCSTFIDWNYEKDYRKDLSYYLGCDIARYGGDENAFVIGEMDRSGNLKIVKALTTARVSITDTIGRIKKINDKFRFKKIFVDDAGVGGGVLDALQEDLGKSKVVGLNNASRSVRTESQEKRRRILKEDLYSQSLVMMENKESGRRPNIEMISDLRLIGSLKSITYEYTKEGNFKIHGKNSHLAEAFVRVCWAVKSKGLKLFVA